MNITKLKLKLSERKNGRYFFSGLFLVTSRVCEEIQLDEIIAIYIATRELAIKYKGIDYLQVIEDDNGRKLFFIDQLSHEMIASGQFEEEDNYCVLMFSDEY